MSETGNPGRMARSYGRDVTDGAADYRKIQAEAETGYPMDEIDEATGERIAWDREEADYCERGTFGCSLHHTRDSECATW